MARRGRTAAFAKWKSATPRGTILATAQGGLDDLAVAPAAPRAPAPP